MDVALRKSIRRTVSVMVVVAALSAGWVLHGMTGTSVHTAARTHAHTPTKLTASDVLLAAESATAGIYLQFDGITGPPGTTYAQDAPVDSFSFGLSRGTSGTGGNRVIGSPRASDISITHPMDKYSVPLLQEADNGQGTANAVLYFTNVNMAGGLVKYLEFDLGHVAITSFQTSSGGTTPFESLTLNALSITVIAHVAGSPIQTLMLTLS